MTEKQVQTRAARRQAMVKERRNVHRQRYDRNKREMMIIKGISIALALIVLGALGFAAFNWAQDRNLNRAPEGVKTFQYAQGNHIEGNIDYSAQAGYQGGEQLRIPGALCLLDQLFHGHRSPSEMRRCHSAGGAASTTRA